LPVIPQYEAKEDLNPDSRGMPRPTFTTAVPDAEARTAQAMGRMGAGITQMGDGLQAIADRNKQMQEQKAAFNTKLAFDKFGAELDREESDALQKAPADGSGWTQSRIDAFSDKSQKFLNETVPPHLREEYAQRLDVYKEKKLGQYSSTEAKMLGDFTVKQLNEDYGVFKQRVYNDPAHLDESLKEIDERVKIAPGVAEASKPALRQQLRYGLTAIAAGRMHPDDPEATADMLGVQYTPPARRPDGSRAVVPGAPRGATVSGRAHGDEGRAMAFFQGRGWTKEQAAGIVGNLIQESRLRTGARNPGDGSDGSDSIGIAQWNSGRATALKNFAASRGKPVTDLDTQLAFVDHELRTSHSGAGEKLRNARSAAEAAAAIVTDYERPKGSNRGASMADGWGNRLGHARRLAGGAGDAEPTRVAAQDTGTTSDAPASWAINPVQRGSLPGEASSYQRAEPDRPSGLDPSSALQPANDTGGETDVGAAPERQQVAQASPPRQKLAQDPRFDILSLEDKLKVVRQAETEQARKQRAMQQQVKADNAAVSTAIDDDLASLERSGQGMSEDKLNYGRVAAALGEEKARAWEAERGRAIKVHAALDGIETLSEPEVMDRLAQLEPQPGSQGYVADMQTYKKAEQRARKFLEARNTDPALAVEAFPTVKDARASAQYQNTPNGKAITPESAQAIIGARLQAQRQLGIEEPLAVTRSESRILARQLRQIGDENEAGLEKFMGALDQTYGPYADKVLSSVIQHQNVNKDLANVATDVLRKISMGHYPNVKDATQLENMIDWSQTQQALSPPPADRPRRTIGGDATFRNQAATPGGGGSAATPQVAAAPAAPQRPQVTYRTQDIIDLKNDRGMAPEFDRKYYPGAAEEILKEWDRRTAPRGR
jgi:hypothetical protein